MSNKLMTKPNHSEFIYAIAKECLMNKQQINYTRVRKILFYMGKENYYVNNRLLCCNLLTPIMTYYRTKNQMDKVHLIHRMITDKDGFIRWKEEGEMCKMKLSPKDMDDMYYKTFIL